MATPGPSTFQSTFSEALGVYKKRIKIDLFLHPLAVKLQHRNSPQAVISVLQEQARAIDQSLLKSLHPTVKVIYTLSSGLEGVRLALSPAEAIFVGFGVLLTIGASQDGVIDILRRMEQIFQRLEPLIKIPPPQSVKDKSQEILLVVLSVLTSVTENITQRRAKKCLKKLLGRDVVKDGLQSLGKLILEMTQMVTTAEVSNIGHGDIRKRIVSFSSQELEVAVSPMADDVGHINRSPPHSAVVDTGSTSHLLDQLRCWISTSDPSLNHKIMRDASHMGTGRWFLQSTVFGQWKCTLASSLLWVHGRPGSGKSVLCSAIIDDIRVFSEAKLAYMAYFYFDFRDIHKQSRRDLISSVLFQLSTQSIHYRDMLHRLYLAHYSGIQAPSDGVLMECLKDMLLIPNEVPVYIFMDAIDECSNTPRVPSPREEILDFVEELVNLRLPNLRLCVTSRPEIDIHVVLEPLLSFGVSLHDQTGQKEDLADYIRSFVHSDRWMRRWRKEDKELVIQVLTERADRGFRWVYCQLEVLYHCRPSSVHRVLEELPETLDETYERILRDISKPNIDHVRRLLQCLAVATRPLCVEELAEVFRHAVNFDNEGATPKRDVAWRWEDQEQAVLSACSSLVKVVTFDGSKMVKLSHFSVKAFLTSDRLAAASSGDVSQYHILPELAHTTLARACLNVLLRLEGHLDLDSINHFPLAEYAAKHWVDHAQFEYVASHIQEGMELLFDPEKPHFVNWVSIYDMDEILWLPTPPHPTRPNAAPLYYAALCGFSSLVDWLIVERHMDVNMQGGHYFTAIQAALYKRHLSIVRLLIGHGVDVNTHGSNLLQTAAQIGDPEAVSLLLSLGAGVQATDSNNSSLLFMMLNKGNLTETRRLLDHGVDANARDEEHVTALHISSNNGNVELVEVLFQYGAKVDPRDSNGSTPLHLASAKGNHATVGLLMEHSADVNALDNKNLTPLHCAFDNQNLDIAALLIEKGADVKVLETPLHLALSNGNSNLVRQLIQRGVDVNGRDKNNLAPLHLASAKGDSAAIELLIDKNVDLDAPDNAQSTPLHLALINGNLDVAKLLVEKGANVNVSDSKKRIPLHLVLPNKNLDLVNLLVQRGADVNIRGNNNSTPLHIASRHGPCESIDLLLKHRGDPNVRDNSGSSPLHIASQRGAMDIAENLLKGGAKVNLKDGNRKTPLHLASNNKKMARLLIRYGADAFALDKEENMPLQHGLDVRNKQSRTLRG